MSARSVIVAGVAVVVAVAVAGAVAPVSAKAGYRSDLAPSNRATANAQAAKSAIWGGYVATPKTGQFNRVTATWVQPRVSCAQAPAYEATFVALDGYSDQSLEQAGVYALCSGSSATYYAFWDMYQSSTQNPTEAVFPVAPGDTITAIVAYVAPEFVLTVQDKTTGQSFTQDETCAASCLRNSAEVAAEPLFNSSTQQNFPLADYGTTAFSGISMHNSHGKTGTFTNTNWNTTSLNQVSGATTLQTVSALNKKTSKAAAGSRFTDTWHHA